MLYYYQYQTHQFLVGTAEQLRRFHMDYDPQPTREQALEQARAFFERQRAEYQDIADCKAKHRDEIPDHAPEALIR